MAVYGSRNTEMGSFRKVLDSGRQFDVKCSIIKKN